METTTINTEARKVTQNLSYANGNMELLTLIEHSPTCSTLCLINKPNRKRLITGAEVELMNGLGFRLVTASVENGRLQVFFSKR